MLTGIVLYFMVNYLLGLPGSRKIDRLYETEAERRKRREWRRRTARKYIIILFLAVIATNLFLYYAG